MSDLDQSPRPGGSTRPGWRGRWARLLLVIAWALAPSTGPFARAMTRLDLNGEPLAGGAATSEKLPPPTRAVPGQYVVRFRAGPAHLQSANPAVELGPGIATVRRLRGLPGRGVAPASGVAQAAVFDRLALVVTDGSVPAGEVRARLERHPAVAYVEPNFILTTFDGGDGERFPSDFRFADQWSLLNVGLNAGLPGADIEAPLAWGYTTGDPAIQVAVIDTGIDYYHPDLEANVWNNPGEIPGNGLDDDHNGYVDDVHGYDFVSDDSDPMDDQIHGTHVAGTIGAVGNNDIGVCGVCWRTSLMALKAFNERGEGALFDVIGAIHYAVANGARVLNASWGQTDKSQALADAIAGAHASGLVIVAAAGNSRSETLSYPAAYPESVTVAATNNRDQRSLFSSFGAFVDLSAPGENILSTVPDNRYDLASGTSMATPHVAGVAALVLSRHPEFTNTQVEDVLRNAVDPLSGSEYLGLGRLNALKAVRVEVALPTARLELPAILSGRVSLLGSATGPRFASYALDYGQGVYPTNWTRLHTGDAVVEHGALFADWATDRLAEGSYVFRLTVRDTLGQEAVDRTTATVRNVLLATPAHNDVLRAGELVVLRGTVFGAGRTYTIEHGVGRHPVAWRTDGITLTQGGTQEVVEGVLGTWDTRAVGTNEFYTLKLTAWANGQSVGTWLETLVYLDGRLRPGWPQYVTAPAGYSTNDWRQVTVADLDRDGAQEIIAVEAGNNEGKAALLLVYGLEGRLRWSRDLPSGLPTGDLVTVGDLDGDGFGELLVDVGDSGKVWGFHYDGRPLGGNWPAQVGAMNLGKSLADLDGDGKLEVIVYGENTNLDAPDSRVLAVLNADGTVRRRWSFPGSQLPVDAPRQFAAVGDLDDDPELEIVAIVRGSDVGLFDLRNPGGPVWLAGTQGALCGSPVIGDVVGDHRGTIIVGAYDAQAAGKAGTHGGIYLFDRQGRLLPGWPVLIDQSFVATPALADFDGDGAHEIVAVNWDLKLIHVLRRDGFNLPGWPVGPVPANGATDFPMTGWIKSTPVVGDLDGDGVPDVVLIAPGLQGQASASGDVSFFGGVKAWSVTGAPIDLHPRPELVGLVMEAGSGSRWKAAPPILTDLDGNGRLDVVASTVEDVGYPSGARGIVPKGHYSIYAWELDVPGAPTNPWWPMVQHDPQHTGWLPSPKPINRPPVISAIPSQTIRTGSTFFPIELDRYVEDPDNAVQTLVWRVEGAVELIVRPGADRVIRVQPPTPTWAGSETLRLVVQDPGGLEASTSATFAARVDYEPPQANPDELELAEDASVEVDPLANDTHPRGLPLQLLQVSRARFGSVNLTADHHVRYRPNTNYFGADSFTYLVGDGQDGMAIGLVTVRVLPLPDPPVAQDDYVITLENTPVGIDVLANDTDPDGDPLTIVALGQPAFGTVETLVDRTLWYRPNPNWSGNDGFTYRVGDGHGFEATAVVKLQVKPVNTRPMAHDLAFTLNRNTQQDLTFLADDADGDLLTFTVVDGPAHGELWASPTVATFYPKKGYSGADQFTYVANDGELTSAAATVRFTILELNNPPVGTPQSLVSKPNRPLTLPLSGTDPDDDPLTFLIGQMPAHGSVTLAGANFIYRPRPNYLGSDSFTFTVSDGQATSPPALISLRLTDQNTAPVVESYSLVAPMNVPTNLVLRATDGENDPLQLTIVTNPAHGRFTGTPPNLTFTPQTNYYGLDRFAFIADDGLAKSAPGVVVLTIARPNQPPEATSQTLGVTSDAPLSFRLQVTDADQDWLRAAILKGPQHGRLYGSGTNYTFVPGPGFVGADSFTYRVWDGTTYCAITTVSINVWLPPPPKPPVFEGLKLLDDGSMQIRVATAAGKPLDIYTSTNLVTWSLFLSTTPTFDTVTFVDTNAPAVPWRFYRAVRP